MNRISSTCFQTALSATLSRTLVGTNSTGKEKDSESGYHYFGARYYDSELLTGWLSVDPMSDKYPSMSPYNYCAWNPIVLIDPMGDSCKFATKEDESYVKQLLDVNDKRHYSKAFAEKYSDLDKSKHCYLFGSWEYDESRTESGEFQPKSNYSTIKFTMGTTPETQNEHIGASEFRVLFEEVFHAWKFQKNNCKAEIPTCTTEAEAWKFSTKAPGTNFYIRIGDGCEQTIMGRINNGTIEQVAKGLHEGFKEQPNSGGAAGFGKAGMPALYPYLPLK